MGGADSTVGVLQVPLRNFKSRTLIVGLNNKYPTVLTPGGRVAVEGRSSSMTSNVQFRLIPLIVQIGWPLRAPLITTLHAESSTFMYYLVRWQYAVCLHECLPSCVGRKMSVAGLKDATYVGRRGLLFELGGCWVQHQWVLLGGCGVILLA